MERVTIIRKKPKVTKADFFSRSSAEQILRGKTEIIASDDLVSRIETLDVEKEALVIRLNNHGLIPAEMYPTVDGARDFTGRTFASRKFMKHGDLVTLEEVTDKQLMAYVQEKQGMHVAFRKRAFDGYLDKMKPIAGYGFSPVTRNSIDKPVIGRNDELRHVPLVECVNAAFMLYYWYHSPAQVDVQAIRYHHWKKFVGQYRRLKMDGLQATVVIPSRTKNKPRHKVHLGYVPMYDNDFARVLPFSIKSVHQCDVVDYARGLNFEISDQPFERMYFDAHSIFSYFALATSFYQRSKNKKLEGSQGEKINFQREEAIYHAMRRNSPFALPTESQMQYNYKLLNNVVIEALTSKGDEKAFYPLNIAEREILNWGRVFKRGHYATFFADARKPIANYQLF